MMRGGPAVVGLLLLCSSLGLAAQGPALSHFFAEPVLDQAVLSADGRFVAALERREDGGQTLVVLDAQRLKRQVRSFHRERVLAIHWVTPERLVLALAGAGESPGLMAINRDGSAAVRLFTAGASARPQLGAQLVDSLPDLATEILVASDHREPWAPDLYRVNLFSAAAEQLERNPGNVYRWLSDQRGTVRAAMSWSQTDQGVIYALSSRLRSDRPLLPTWALPLAEGSFAVLGVHSDRRRLLLQLDQPGQPSGVRVFDPTLRSFGELLVDSAGRTIDAVRWAGEAKLPAWIETRQDRLQREFFSDEAREWHARLDAHLGTTENRILGMGGNVALVLASSDRDPGTWWTYDIESDRLRRIGQRMPWFRANRAAAMQVISFPARDGLPLSGYLTLPQTPGGSLVLYPHGGPWSRDSWGFDPVVQFLASRGHAVLQINYRGSRGFGHEFMMRGQRQWGQAMQDDLVDGLRWAIAQGHAEPGRIGVLGASYGGFAALRLVLDEPELVAAAAVFAPVSDVPGQMAHYRRHGHMRAVAEWTMMVGEPDDEELQQLSPLSDAANLQRPVLLAHGRHDSQVPIAASKRFADSAEASWLQTLWLEHSGHELHRADEAQRYYGAVERLFERLHQPL